MEIHNLHKLLKNDGSSKEKLHFDDQSKEVVFLFSLQCFLKEIENTFLSSYKNPS